MEINTDKEIIKEILERSISQVLPTKEKLEKLLTSKKRLRIYLGADATGTQLHIGHSTNLIVLEKLRKLGHKVFFLFGDFTAMIGDPTDKGATRKVLTKEDVENNIATWKEQVSKIIDFEDSENPAEIVYNSHWWSKKTFDEIISIASNFTVQQMLERDMFQKRMEDSKPIALQEFLYPLMQGYDSVELDVDLEIGGTDQTFNMLAGRTLQRKYNNREKYVMSTTLLENPLTGKKLMSKSEGSFIGLNDEPNEMYGKTMSLCDEVIISCFIDCTFMSMPEIQSLENDIKNGGNPRDAKMRLGYELVKIYHGDDSAIKAQEHFISQFQKKEIPDDLKEYTLSEEIGLLNLVSNVLKFTNSNGEAIRKVKEGALKINGTRVDDYKMNINLKSKEEIIIKLGRKIAKVIGA